MTVNLNLKRRVVFTPSTKLALFKCCFNLNFNISAFYQINVMDGIGWTYSFVMFSDIIKRLHTVFKLKVSLTLFVLVLITLAFVNFFILISLKTNAHEQPESLLDSLFLIHIHRNVSVFAHDKRKVNLNETKKMTRGDAVNISDSTRGKLRDKAKRRSRTTARFKTRTTIQQSLPREGENFLKHMKTPKTNNGRVYLPSTSGLDCTSWCRRGNGLKPLKYNERSKRWQYLFKNNIAKDYLWFRSLRGVVYFIRRIAEI